MNCAMGDLVERKPQPELARRKCEHLLERKHVGPYVIDEILIVRILFLDDQEVVLA